MIELQKIKNIVTKLNQIKNILPMFQFTLITLTKIYERLELEVT